MSSNIHPVDFGDIEVPANCRLEYRLFEVGDMVHDGIGWVVAGKVACDVLVGTVIVAVPDWTPPEFLKPGWVAMDANGSWNWHEAEPMQRSNYFEWTNSGRIMFLGLFNWSPPSCTDWTQSKHRIEAQW